MVEAEWDDWVLVRRPSNAEIMASTGDVELVDSGWPLKVVFAGPAKYWTDAAPIGNGSLGAMIWGGVPSERIQINRKRKFRRVFVPWNSSFIKIP